MLKIRQSFSKLAISTHYLLGQYAAQKIALFVKDKDYEYATQYNTSVYKPSKVEWITEKELNYDNTTLSDVISSVLSNVEEIQKIYIFEESLSNLHVWSVVSEKKPDVRKKIYAQEKILIRYFKDFVNFDFHIAEISDVEYLTQQNVFLIYKK